MNWGRKKKSGPSSSPASIINMFFPVSWLSRFKGSSKSWTHSDKSKQGSESHNFRTPPEGRFYSMDEDDPYWRLSFGQERIHQGRRSTGGINPLWFDSCNEFEFRGLNFEALDLGEVGVVRREEGCQNFSDMVSDMKRMKQEESKRVDGGSEPTNQSRKDLVGQGSRNLRHQEKILNSVERDVFPVELDNGVEMEGHIWKSADGYSRMQPQILTSLKEVKAKNDSPNKPAKTKQNDRVVKAYSPGAECKITALEEMKKSKMKWKKKKKKKGEKEQLVEGKTIFDSFAVVKSSYDPQKDFRDSIAEMIREKGIWRSQELEELLACYLTLNCDEFHDLIIKVFRQVWFEIGGLHRSSSTERQMR